MKGKGGRPRKEVRREKYIGIRLTKTEYFVIKEKARKAGIRIGAYVRNIAIEGKIIARLTPEERQFVKELRRIGYNVNQLARLAHKGDFQEAIFLLNSYRDGLDELLKYINHDQ